MLTVLNALELSSNYLIKKGVESPRLNAELLLADILGCNRMELYLKFDQPLSENEKLRYRDFIKRRGEREPFQYIIGKTEFFGLKIKVTPDVLIPRPETELLIERVLEYAEKFASCRILEIGTGSGNIAISLANNISNSEIYAIDISEAAITIAEDNYRGYSNNGKLKFKVIDIEDFQIDSTDKYDIIVSNPPYISNKDYNNLEKELLDYEPKIALTDESDGFKFYRLIAKKSSDLLKKGGRLFFEIGYGQSEYISDIMKMNNFVDLKIIRDYQNIDRVIDGELE